MIQRVAIIPLLWLFVIPAWSAEGRFRVKEVCVTREDRVRAMRERPYIFGAGIIWTGRSLKYKMPEDFNQHLIERVEQAGVTATRFGFDWATIEEEPTEYDWSIPEEKKGLNRLFKLDVEVIGLISTVPGWASPTGEGGTFAPVDEAAPLFEAFCTELAKRYKGKIRYWQYGQNMDIDPGWQPKADAVQYARWLKLAYRALKAGNPDCVVSTGGHLGRNPGFLETIYKQGGKDFLDAVAVHPWPTYEAPQGDEAFDWQRVEDYRAVMVKYGDARKPMWCTEFGWAFEKVGPEKQRAFAVRALDYLVHYDFITVGVYISMADWHRGHGGLFGLCDKDLKPRPAFEVWQQTIKSIRPPGKLVPQPSNSAPKTQTQPAEPRTP